MEAIKYYLGLDMGTSSVGWAVTDKNYQLLRAKGKDLWGVREFEEAQSAAERRTNRVSRRRRQREVVRLGLVKHFFADEIEKVDPQFFLRIENSKYFEEDKDETIESRKYILFNDENFTDVDYYRRYPTVFHLRKELMENTNAPYDVRLVYLAVSNMFKHRGHFLLSGVDAEDNGMEMAAVYDELISTLADDYGIHLIDGKFESLIAVLGDSDLSRSRKAERLMELYQLEKSNKKEIAFLKVLCGLKVDVTTLFDIELEDKYSLCFHDFSYNDKIPELIEKVGEDIYSVIEQMKRIYDYAALDAILKGAGSLSEARVKLYEKHHKDLSLLKAVYRKHKSQEAYDRMFRSKEDGTYSAYVKSLNSEEFLENHGKYRRNMKKRSVAELYASIKADLKNCDMDEDIQYILNEIEKETFLPKQLTGANGVIPNQVHKRELIKILNNAQEYLPFLKEKDETGISVADKIVQLFSFQIPYYVGPVGEHSTHGWAVRKQPGAVLPWNIDEKIDMEKTSEEFINRLIRTCTYINGEKVMPKASLLYEQFCVLNEINNIRVDGERISPELKQSIYTELFQSGKKVTRKKLCNFLQCKGAIQSEEQVTGIDVTINTSLSSYGRMYAIFGDKLKEDKYKNIAEDIIRWGTIYGDSTDMFRKKLEMYVQQGILTKEQVKRIAGYKFKDWARFSKALLELQGCDKSTGECISLIRAMWEYNLNFMELINSSDFTFREELENKKNTSLKTLSDFEFSDLDEYYFSAPVKRMIWQTLLIIRELESVLGSLPERIFIEMTRTDEEKGDNGRKNSRGRELLEAYKGIQNTAEHEWKTEIKDADEKGKLRSKKLYLYYTQMGCDAYTGKPIDIEELYTNKYDIDHIYPRHYVKDDSIVNNLVLVNKEANEHLKKDIYPIPETIRQNDNVRKLWNVLHQKKLITDEKYRRLTSSTPFSDEQKAGFIARQMVETGQGTKGVADLLKQLIPETTIVYSKAGNVSDFRRDNGFYKSRLVNEFHHANDAYLNIVVGNVYFTKFTQNPMNFIAKEYDRDQEKNHYNLARMFDWNVQRDGEVAWVKQTKESEGTIATVRKVMAKNTPLVTRLSYMNRGALYNVQPISKFVAKEANYSRIHENLSVEKYGGYGSLKPAYFIFIEYGPVKKRKRAFDVISIVAEKYINNEADLINYCENVYKYKDVRIICSKIKKDSLFRLNGYYLYIVGLDSRKYVEFHNAVNMCLEKVYVDYIKKIENSIKKDSLDKEITADKNCWLYQKLLDKHMNSIYAKHPKTLGKILEEGEEYFVDLDLKQQVLTLYKILQFSSLGKVSVGLKEIGGPATDIGRIRFSGNMTDCSELKMIHLSPTGLFESVVDLLSL